VRSIADQYALAINPSRERWVRVQIPFGDIAIWNIGEEGFNSVVPAGVPLEHLFLGAFSRPALIVCSV
jgi:hypothetical protein